MSARLTAEIATALAEHFKPEGVYEYNPETRRYDIHRKADGRDSTMAVLIAGDGERCLRALKFSEIAPVAESILAARIDAVLAEIERRIAAIPLIEWDDWHREPGPVRADALDVVRGMRGGA